MSDIGFAHNYTNLYEIFNPDVQRWLRIAAGIATVSWEGNEDIAQDKYYDGNGLAESEVTGGQIVGSFEGHRLFGDPAQEFIAGLLLDYMNRRTDFRWTQPDGSKLEGDVTIANITPQGGDAADKSDFGFEIHFNGMPVFTPADEEDFPTSITATDVDVEVGAAELTTVKVSPATASPTVFFSIDDTDIATVDSDGTVHGIASGTTELLVRSAVLPTVYAVANVTVG